VVGATYCWWGSPDGPEYKDEGDPDDPEEVYSVSGAGYLLYEPWLEEPCRSFLWASIRLVEGWNLIGLPVEPVNGSVIAVFSEHIYYVEAIYAYYNGTWHYWLGMNMSNTLGDLRPGYGYWMFVSKSFNLIIVGHRCSRPEMVEGWNLIAVASLSSESVEEYLEGYDWRAVYDYVEENGTWLYYIRGVGGCLTTLEPGEGYWVYIDPPVDPSSAPSELSEERSDPNPSWINARDSSIYMFLLLGLIIRWVLEELKRRLMAAAFSWAF